jgi:hypothetical protein
VQRVVRLAVYEVLVQQILHDPGYANVPIDTVCRGADAGRGRGWRLPAGIGGW